MRSVTYIIKHSKQVLGEVNGLKKYFPCYVDEKTMLA